jgi:hypothetical protein
MCVHRALHAAVAYIDVMTKLVSDQIRKNADEIWKWLSYYNKMTDFMKSQKMTIEILRISDKKNKWQNLKNDWVNIAK